MLSTHPVPACRLTCRYCYTRHAGGGNGMLEWVLVVLIACSVAYSAVVLVAARLARRHRNDLQSGFPPVSILKPIKGLDPELAENLRSFCRQDYPEYEVLFGVADPADPAVPAIRQVLAELPQTTARLVLCLERLGPSGKVSNLHQMAGLARHDILVVSDSDTRVGPDYLRRVTAPFDNPQVGVVTALYRGIAPEGCAALLERLMIHTTFVPGILAGYLLEGITFAFGATLAVRRKVLDEMGGFAALTHMLNEDYQIAQRARAAGHTVAFADLVVDCVLGRMTFREFFARQVRWSRTNRIGRPGGYACAVIRHGVLWSLLLLVASGPTPLGLAALAATVTLRLAVVLTVGSLVLRLPDPARGLWLLPLADALSLVTWGLAYTGNTVTWRGGRYRVTRGGHLEPLPPRSS